MNMMRAESRRCKEDLYVAIADGADPMKGTLDEIMNAIKATSSDVEEPLGNANRYTLNSYDGKNFFAWEIIRPVEAREVW